jgi:aarF domain-containing kinase
MSFLLLLQQHLPPKMNPISILTITISPATTTTTAKSSSLFRSFLHHHRHTSLKTTTTPPFLKKTITSINNNIIPLKKLTLTTAGLLTTTTTLLTITKNNNYIVCQELLQQQPSSLSSPLPRRKTIKPKPTTSSFIKSLPQLVQTWLKSFFITCKKLLKSTYIGLGHLTRFLELAIYFTPPLLTAPLLFFPGKPRHTWRMILIQSLNLGGPAFQKLGQWASTRPDLFGKATREDLESFHSSVPVESWSKTAATLEDAFGGKMSEIFSSFDEKPIGAGCIAQVHRAMLRSNPGSSSNGKPLEVAVKVRRHNVARVVQRDVDLLVFLGWALESLIPPLRFLAVWETARNFSTFMTSQLDLRVEGNHLKRFRTTFAKNPDVTFPEPILSTETVLVETFEPGIVLSKVLALDHERIPIKLRHKMAEVGMKTFLEMVIVHNHTHGDLHPGNMFLRTIPPFDLEHPEKPVKFDKLVLVDAGLVTELQETDQNNFIALFEAVADGDGERAARLMVERSRDPTSCIDQEGFIEGMSEIVNQVKLDSFRLDKVQIGTVLEKVLNLVHKHQVRLEPNFTSLVVAIIVLEGVGRQLNPELDIFYSSLPMLRKAQAKYQTAVAKVGFKVGLNAIRRNTSAVWKQQQFD